MEAVYPRPVNWLHLPHELQQTVLQHVQTIVEQSSYNLISQLPSSALKRAGLNLKEAGELGLFMDVIEKSKIRDENVSGSGEALWKLADRLKCLRACVANYVHLIPIH